MKNKTHTEEYKEKRLKEFDDFISGRTYLTGDNTNLIKNFISETIDQTLHQERNAIIKEVEKIKEAVRKSTGSFKYDSCYEDVINLMKQRLNYEK